MGKAIVPVQRLQPGHDDFYNPPVQPLPDQHRWSQIPNQNGRRFPESLTEHGEAFVGGCSPFRGGACAIERGSLQFFPMKAVIDCVVGKCFQRGPQNLGGTLLSQVADIVAALDAFQGGFVPARAARLAAGGAKAMAESLAIFALHSDHRYMMTKGRLDSEETPTQVRSLQAERFLVTPRGFLRKLFDRIGPPPTAQQSVAFDDFLQRSQHNRLAGCSCRKARRSCGTKTMRATRSRKKISEIRRNPLWFSARHITKADPQAASPAGQGLEREIVTGVLLRVKKHPALGGNGRFIKRPTFVAGFNRCVLLRRIGEKALDGFRHACGCRSVFRPAASSHVQEAGLLRIQMGNDSSTNGDLRVMRSRRRLLEITEQSRKPALIPDVTHVSDVFDLGEQSGQWGSRKTLCVVHSIVLVSTTCSRYTPTDGSDCAEDSIFQRASAA